MKEIVDQKVAISESQCSKSLAAVEDALYVVGGKWTLRVMIALSSGHTRFNDLQRTLKGISARVLSGELKDLEINGLVKRVVDPSTKPVAVNYEPTEYSKSLESIIASLADWGIKHKTKITTLE